VRESAVRADAVAAMVLPLRQISAEATLGHPVEGRVAISKTLSPIARQSDALSGHQIDLAASTAIFSNDVESRIFRSA
jgi:hypothetical protein